MADYRAPVKEVKFTAYELLNYSQLIELSDFSEASTELVDAVIEEAGKFAAEVFAPLNVIGDQKGSKVVEGSVKTPEGFKEAFQLFIENGWMSLAQSEVYGGQGLPFTVHMMASEFWCSSNTSLSICPMLNAGAVDVLMAHGTQELRDIYLDKMVSAQWTGTMNLTESHAGSDLSNLKTKATPEGDHFRIKGQKIYITWGDHDMVENIIHIVLAPLADAPAGVKGLSLFVVPKYLVNEDGSLGERNDVKVVSTEHKLGINASPTCVMSFGENEGAVGYMIGEPGQGLNCMFTLMNHARLEVGLEGVGLSERAYQDALQYARDRIQGRNASTGEPAAIIEHADVQRMLMQMKSMTDAMRALCLDASISHDLRTHGESAEQRSYHEARFALLTPLSKGWCTELVNEVTSLGIQVHGGMGFIEETGVAQHYRDARITAIYEGTNAIQANDLVGRKLVKDGGEAFAALMSEIKETLLLPTTQHCDQQANLAAAVARLEEVADFIIEGSGSDVFFEGSISFNFLMQLGYVVGAWYHLRGALIAEQKLKSDDDDKDFFEQKQLAARFYSSQVLPRAESFAQAIVSGAEVGVQLSPTAFA